MAAPSFNEYLADARQFSENDSYTDNDIWTDWNNGFAEQYQVEQTGDTVAGLKSGIAGAGTLIDYGQAAASDLVGLDGLRDSNIEEAQAGEQEAAKWSQGRTSRVEDVDGIGSAVDWFQFQMGNLVPSIVETGAAGLIGGVLGGGANPVSALGGMAFKGALKDLIKHRMTEGLAKDVAEKVALKELRDFTKDSAQNTIVAQIAKNNMRSVGASIGAGAAGYQMGVGDLYGTSVEAGDPSALTAFAGAVPYALADALAGKVITDPLTRGMTGGTRLGNTGKVMGAGFASEAAAESSQQELNIQLQAYLDPSFDPTGEEANSQRLNSAIAGGMMGASLGSANIFKAPQVERDEEVNQILSDKAKFNIDRGYTPSLEELQEELRLKAETTAQRTQYENKEKEELAQANLRNKQNSNIAKELEKARKSRELRIKEEAKSSLDQIGKEAKLDYARTRSGELRDNLRGSGILPLEGEFASTDIGDGGLGLPKPDVLSSRGNPFTTEKQALISRKRFKDRALVPVQVDGGWVLRDADRLGQGSLPILDPVTDNPTINVSQGGTGFTDEQARNAVQRQRDLGLTPDLQNVTQPTITPNGELDAVSPASNVLPQNPIGTDASMVQDTDVAPIAVPSPGIEDTASNVVPESQDDSVTNTTNILGQKSPRTVTNDTKPAETPADNTVQDNVKSKTYVDDRLKEDKYSGYIKTQADELVVGGNMGYVRNENDVIIKRTGSENPKWFQDAMVDAEAEALGIKPFKPSVKRIKDVVEKATNGEKLTGKQDQAIVQWMLNGVDSVYEDQAAADIESKYQAELAAEYTAEQDKAELDREAQRKRDDRKVDADRTASKKKTQAVKTSDLTLESEKINPEASQYDFINSDNDPFGDSTGSNDPFNMADEKESTEPVVQDNEVTIDSIDTLESFMADADPETAYSIKWSDGKVTKIKDIDKSRDRLLDVAKKKYPDTEVSRTTDPTKSSMVEDEIVSLDDPAPVDPEVTPTVETSEVKEAPIEAVDGVYNPELQDNKDPSVAEAKLVDKAITGKSAIEVITWLSENAPTTAYREIAKRVLNRMERLQKAGVKFDFDIIRVGDSIKRQVQGARGYVEYNMKGGDSTTIIRVKGSDVTGKVGTSYKTLLHEYLHAVTSTAIQAGNLVKVNDPVLKQASGELFDLSNAVVSHINKRLKEGNLSEFEKEIQSRANNFTSSPDEVLAWGLTDSAAQKYLESIPYKKTNAWNTFVSTIRKMLGLSAKSETALSELLRVTDVILESSVDSLKGELNIQGMNLQVDSASTLAQRATDQVSPEMKERYKEAKTIVKRWTKRMFKPGGLLNKTTFDFKLEADAQKNVGEEQTQYLSAQLRKATEKEYNVKRYIDIPQEAKDKINAYLNGEDVVLAEGVAETAEALRAFLDTLSGEMTKSITDVLQLKLDELSESDLVEYNSFTSSDGSEGSVPNHIKPILDLLKTIENNKGKYVHRSYQAFDDPNWMNKALKNKDLMSRAADHVRQRNLEGIASQSIGTRAKNREALLDDALNYLNDPSFTGFLSEKQINKVDSLREKVLTESQIQGEVEAILQTAKDRGDMSSLLSSGQKYGSKDMSILKKRDNSIPPIIRELLGEHKDPLVNFTKSSSKMQWYVANQKFLMNVREAGLGTFLFKKPDILDGERYIQLTASQTSSAMSPLNGLHATTDFNTGLEDLLDNYSGDGLMRQYIRLNSFVKYGKTVLSPTTQARNFMSAGMFAIMSGHFNWKHGRKAFAVMKSDIFTNEREYHDYITELIGLNVIHNSAYAGELRAALNDFIFYQENPTGAERGIKGKTKSFMEFMQKAYQAGDDFWKIIGYENELKRQLDNNVPLAQAKEKAAYRIRNGYPTYSMVPKGMRWLARFPLTGTFVSFPYEIVRTTINNVRFIKEDWSSDRPAAVQRIIGMSMAASAAKAASELSMALMGIDDEDDEAIKLATPEWSRNSQFLYTGYDKDGLPTYLDLSSLDPYTYLKKPLTAIMSGNNEGIEDKFKDAAWEILSPFLGLDISAGVLFETVGNQKLNGGKVYNEYDDDGEKFIKAFNHVRKGLQPGIASNIEKSIAAVKGDRSRTGKEFSTVDEGLAWIGFRKSTLNLKQSLIYKSYGFQDGKQGSQQILSRVAGSRERVTDDDIKSAFNRSMSARETQYNEMIKLVAGMRRLGVSDREIMGSLRGARVSTQDARFIMRGEVPKWTMSKQFISSAKDRATASAVSEDERRTINKEMFDRRRYVTQMAKEYYQN